MRCVFILLALFTCLPAFTQPQCLAACSESAPAGSDIVRNNAASTANASAETTYKRLAQFAPDSTRIIPAQAESWEVSADGLTHIFNLHQTPWLQPSRALNANDALWSFQRQRDKEHPWHALPPRGHLCFEAMGSNSFTQVKRTP